MWSSSLRENFITSVYGKLNNTVHKVHIHSITWSITSVHWKCNNIVYEVHHTMEIYKFNHFLIPFLNSHQCRLQKKEKKKETNVHTQKVRYIMLQGINIQ